MPSTGNPPPITFDYAAITGDKGIEVRALRWASLQMPLYPGTSSLSCEVDLIPLIGERKETTIMPEMDVRLALGFGCDCACLRISAELGYEFHYFFHALTPLLEFCETTVGSRRGRDIGFGGPYVGLKLRMPLHVLGGVARICGACLVKSLVVNLIDWSEERRSRGQETCISPSQMTQ